MSYKNWKLLEVDTNQTSLSIFFLIALKIYLIFFTFIFQQLINFVYCMYDLKNNTVHFLWPDYSAHK